MLYLPQVLKRCAKCQQLKPATLKCFNVSQIQYSKSGLAHRCKDCTNAYFRERRKKKGLSRHPNNPVVNGVKRCNRCMKVLPATPDYFYCYPKGVYPYCKQCAADDRKKRASTIVVETDSRAKCIRCQSEYPLTIEHFARIRGRLQRVCRPCLKKSKNKENEKALNARRRARKRDADGKYDAKDVARQYRAQKGKCYWCGIKVGGVYHVDHVIPLARGGTNGPENIVISCPHCNLSKHDKLPHEWSDKLL